MLRRAAIVGFGLLALIAGCRRREAPQAAALEVEVTPVVQRDVPVTSEWIGTLDGSVNADIRPKIEGYLLRQLYKEGQFVHARDRLFEIDPRQFRGRARAGAGGGRAGRGPARENGKGRGAIQPARG